MPSAEHILNQTMDRMFGCGRCFAAHIERQKSKCDYHFERWRPSGFGGFKGVFKIAYILCALCVENSRG
jgi:hypothetical protein